ncbi:MAG: hypothetical protein H0W06_08415 [Chloroflexia bacterium]|nr:hypothetical protein [Chloroflexia bacterium]
MSELRSPCRLFVYLAREAPIGVVLRRGPSDWVRLSVWHTDVDSFEHGQWMRARVFERRSDVSADGTLFVSFVRGSQGPDPQQRDTWVAISRPPWFTALALWFVGGTYCAGGYFPERESLWIGFDPNPLDQGHLPNWFTATTSISGGYTEHGPNWTERTVWFNRLRRGGWERVADEVPETWQRPSPTSDVTLLMTIHSASSFDVYGGPHVLDYALRAEPTGQVIPLGRATWADWDQRGRLIIAQDGKLCHWQSQGNLRQIADFNPHTPEPSASPAWARIWPKRPTPD